jgi:hypothetical protein
LPNRGRSAFSTRNDDGSPRQHLRSTSIWYIPIMSRLGRAELIIALTRLGELSVADGDAIELLIVGGGVMVLAYDARDATKDLDGVVINSIAAADVRKYASTIAAEHGWNPDWLNDAAKGFLIGPVDPVRIFSASGINVYRPSVSQLLAMKLSAWRDDTDIADAARLLAEMPDGRDLVWAMVVHHLQPGKELKAKLAFDDLWGSRYHPASP